MTTPSLPPSEKAMAVAVAYCGAKSPSRHHWAREVEAYIARGAAEVRISDRDLVRGAGWGWSRAPRTGDLAGRIVLIRPSTGGKWGKPRDDRMSGEPEPPTPGACAPPEGERK